MKQLGDTAALRKGQTKWMFAADRGRPSRAYQYNWLHCVLPEKLPTDEPLKTTMRVYAKFPPNANLTLQLQVKDLQVNDKVAVKLNGKNVNNLKLAGGGWLNANLEPSQVRFGVNQIDLQLAPATKPNEPRTATALELHVGLPRNQ